MKLKLENGDTLYYLGEARTLRVIREERSRARVKMAMDLLLLWVPYEADYAYRRDQLEKWYRKEAAVVFQEKAGENYAASRGEYLNGIIMAAYLKFPFRIFGLRTRKAGGEAAAAKET